MSVDLVPIAVLGSQPADATTQHHRKETVEPTSNIITTENAEANLHGGSAGTIVHQRKLAKASSLFVLEDFLRFSVHSLENFVCTRLYHVEVVSSIACTHHSADPKGDSRGKGVHYQGHDDTYPHE